MTVVEDLNATREKSYRRNLELTGGETAWHATAWPHASGRFVHFLDDDDMVPDGHYAAGTDTFARHPEIGLVFGQVEPFGAGPETQLQHERQFFAQASRSATLQRCSGRKRAFATADVVRYAIAGLWHGDGAA